MSKRPDLAKTVYRRTVSLSGTYPPAERLNADPDAMTSERGLPAKAETAGQGRLSGVVCERFVSGEVGRLGVVVATQSDTLLIGQHDLR